MHLIEHTFSPSRLYLLWQAPVSRDRSHFVVGELRDEDGVISFRYLPDTEDFRKAVEMGFVCYPAFRKQDRVYTDGVMDSFLRRLPPRKRGDFVKYLEQWRLTPNAVLSDFALLAYSGGKLPTDGFSVVWPLDEVKAPGEVLLEIAGFRYQGIGQDELTVGMPVSFIPEPDNQFDPQALRVEAGGKRIGYVERQQRDAVLSWLGRYHVEAFLERFNGSTERPVVYVFCRLTQPKPENVPRTAVR
jgi:hypothetical protein